MSLGALTTTFTPPADCLATTALYQVETSSTFYWLYGKPYQTSCFPSNYNPHQSDYYSPGICPSGYVEKCHELATGGTTTETRARCCPADGDFQCVSTQNSYSYPWGPTLGCMSVYNIDYETAFTTVSATLQGDETAGSSKTIKAPGTMLAYAIPIRYRDGDFTTAASSSSTQTATATESTAVSSQTASTVSETSPASATAATAAAANSGLSAGAAAGIAVGATIGGLLIIGAIAYILWSRRRQRRQVVEPRDPNQPFTYNPELQYPNQYSGSPEQQQYYAQSHATTYDTSTTWSPPPPELSGNNDGLFYEVSGEPVMKREMDGTNTRRNELKS